MLKKRVARERSRFERSVIHLHDNWMRIYFLEPIVSFENFHSLPGVLISLENKRVRELLGGGDCDEVESKCKEIFHVLANSVEFRTRQP